MNRETFTYYVALGVLVAALALLTLIDKITSVFNKLKFRLGLQ